jgi:ribose-phosphate pyrophosphokinase
MILSTTPHKTFKFPVGELQVNLDLSTSQCSNRTDVEFKFTGNESIIELLLFVDAAKRSDRRLGSLIMPYVPFSRQDRINAPGESFSLAMFANLINSLNFKEVVIDDPHSDVTPALLNNVRVNYQWDLLFPLIMDNASGGPFWLVSPDAGALKKTHKLAQLFANSRNPNARCQGVIEAGKIRDTKTGEITGTGVYTDSIDTGAGYYIVDDIIDGGRTFIELAKVLRKMGAQDIHLYATFGFFTKGLSVFDGLIDKIHVVHDLQREKL